MKILTLYRAHLRTILLSALIVLFALFSTSKTWAAGWTPTDAGFAVNLESGDQFLLSVMIDGTEYFVCDYPGYNGGKFKYEAKNYMKLIPQTAGETTPSAASVWTVGAPLTRVNNKISYPLGGEAYTMWGNSEKTLITSDGVFKFLGDLSEDQSNKNLCDVVFVVPSNNERTVCMDPDNTLGRVAKKGEKFNGQIGTGFAGMVYREVYMFAIPRSNYPENAYTNTCLVTFNTTNSTKSWSKGQISCKPGMAAYAYADDKHHPTTRTVFRLYLLHDQAFSYCPSYYFGWDVQDTRRYRKNTNNPQTLSDSTALKKIYRLDHFEGMVRETNPDSSFYKTRVMKMPDDDSTYFYVGYNNTYLTNDTYSGSGSPTNFRSQFNPIDSLRIRPLMDATTVYNPPKNAYGSFVIDTLSGKSNLGVAFEPAGYFLKVPERNYNVQMKQLDDSTWISKEMWTISKEWSALTIKATLFTGAEYSPTDPGADIAGWSIPIVGTSVPLASGGTVGEGATGWARIHTKRTTPNGGMDFVLAESNLELVYDYQGLIGVAIPKQYPPAGGTTVEVQDARLKDGFTFLGWATSRGGDVVYWTRDSIGKGKAHYVGDDITLSKESDTLYAVGYFNDTYRVAFSFIHPTDGKRYFITHPGKSPRYADARHFEEWTNVWQGMGDQQNTDPNYLSTYKLITGPDPCKECTPNVDYILDPQQEVVRGVEDSLQFYEVAPPDDEFLGLYHVDGYRYLLANNTWAGIFQSDKGWPSYQRTAVDSAKLFADKYLAGYPDAISEQTRDRRGYVKYNPVTGYFEDESAEANATYFQITGIAVADAHYVILPDTAEYTPAWQNELTFDYHKDEQQEEQVWSKLIGKQLLAVLRVGEDTVYFHPNKNKILTTANALRQSLDFRLTHNFEFIHDTRPDAALSAGDSVTMEETGDDFHCTITSGMSSPMDVMDGGSYIDVVDTLRVWLRRGAKSKIKKYYGRWQDNQVDSVMPDGSRYRDILIKTKTYHYGENDPQLEIVPDKERYNFSALEGQSQTLNFILRKVTYRPLLDAAGDEVSREVIGIDTITSYLNLTTGTSISLKGGSTIFTTVAKSTTSIRLTTMANNSSGMRIDTLTVTVASITVDEKVYSDVTVKVPLTQSSMQGDELVWSVIHPTTKERIFIMAGKDGEGNGHFKFRKYSLRDNTLYKYSTATPLIKGVKTVANDDDQYITPWKFTINPRVSSQLSLITMYDVEKFVGINVGGTHAEMKNDTTYFTYRLIETNANANANYEEIVRIKYGADKWLSFNGDTLILQSDSASASLFYWGYLQQEYNLLNNGAYPSVSELGFEYNNNIAKSVTTRYKAYREYTMLLNDNLTYLCREEETNLTTLAGEGWQISNTVECIADGRPFDGGAKSSDLDVSTNTSTLVTTVTPNSATSPTEVTIDGKQVDIVDTLKVTLSTTRPDYRFKGDWSGFKSIDDATLKIPLVRKTYHSVPYDSILCEVEHEEYNFAFPSSLRKGVRADSLHTFTLITTRLQGTNTVNVDGQVVSHTQTGTQSLVSEMHLDNPAMAEIRLVDDYGKKPDWCEIEALGANTVTMRCTANGIRSPRSANLYFAYIVTAGGVSRYVNYKLTVSQASLFQYANNQTLIHTPGASGDPLMSDGRQQAHENKRILYYYNPGNWGAENQRVELPVRDRSFYGWWRWYREGKDEYGNDVSDTDAPDSLWITPPRNVGKHNFPYRIIGDSVKVPNPAYKDDPESKDSIKVLVTMGRYTVFHYPAVDYNSKKDAPSKTPLVVPPINKDTITYVVDLSVYYDNLPLSMSQVNQIDTAVLDTLQDIFEPTLSLRESFELHPWTEMAAIMEGYKSANAATYELKDEKYMEDHVVRAPAGDGYRLLLRTEQRYRYDHLKKKSHSESLLGYYMRDDNWSTMVDTLDEDGVSRRDTMIWCGGWDADCVWYTYNPSTKTYAACDHPVTEDDDFLNVPAKQSITAGKDADTVYYCLRAQSKKTLKDKSDNDSTVAGANWFNICRYMIIYHRTSTYGPKLETGTGKNAKAIITNDEIEQNYEVLERLNFDYMKPGADYHVYPHPLPWADASYGYSYPVGPEIPDNRYHNDFAPNFPGTAEYGLINRIPYSKYWHTMEQHGGAENGYMIYCDGMNSAGQVAALSLSTQLCEGQKMYFSGYIGNASNQTGKANPNFTFTVQGSDDGATWKDITSYMTGDIKPSDKWYQIFFPIDQQESYKHYRVKIFNVASDFDGNDFVIDDLCVFATKPPLIAYQANTACATSGENDSITQVVLRMDYQGFVNEDYNGNPVYYTVQQIKGTDTSYVEMMDGYIHEVKKVDSIYGHIDMPAHEYVPLDEDSIFTNLKLLVDSFENSSYVFKQGYIYEKLDGAERPVLYVLHHAKMAADNTYNVRMSLAPHQLTSSVCAMTSNLKVTNHMMLELNGEEQKDKEFLGMCANSTYDVSVRVKGQLYNDSTAPIDLNGSCYNDWLVYGDTAEASSLARYGFRYSDIKKVITGALRIDPTSGTNENQFAKTFSEINRNVLLNYAKDLTFSTELNAYDLLDSLVTKGFLLLYQSKITVTVSLKDSAQYVVFPIEGTGSEAMYQQNMEVCPTPMFIKLKSSKGGIVPMRIGGIHRDSTQANQPVVILADARTANSQLTIHIDSIKSNAAIYSISLLSTDDPDCQVGAHILNLTPDKIYTFGGDMSGYYKDGDDMLLSPSTSNTYQMKPGYSYTFGIVMQTLAGALEVDGCPVGTIPFTVSVVPNYLRWEPRSKNNNKWNDPNNWIGVDANNVVLPDTVHFAPIASTDVIIPNMLPLGLPYPELPDPSTISSSDSIKKVGFVYNTCDDIRFLPGAAISQQQRLTCGEAVVDMTIPYRTWTLRAAPVTGMLSGDLFMADADLNGTTKMWQAGPFDANGRNYKTGNATFWLSLYNSTTESVTKDSTTSTSSAQWSKVTNGMTQYLPAASGFAVYTRTKSEEPADIRLPKSDDRYYYYGTYGERMDNYYVDDLNNLRNTKVGGTAGQLAYFSENKAVDHIDYSLSNDSASTSFLFGNPTMGYIDIWGFIADNELDEEIGYVDSVGNYNTVSKATAEGTTDAITEIKRYLPPMHALMIKTTSGTTKNIRLNANRIVTKPSQKVRAAAPRRLANSDAKARGIMTVTAVNPANSRCVSRLLIGQGYHDEIRSGEDAVLTTLNIDNYSATATPTTPFNIYAQEGGYGMSIDLREEVLNIPLSFYNSDLPFASVTHLWFTGVNSMEGPLVLYDALTDTERTIIDGICLDIETPEANHENRYYIRRLGYTPEDDIDPIATDATTVTDNTASDAKKILYHGQVLILRRGHVFTVFGQKLR